MVKPVVYTNYKIVLVVARKHRIQIGHLYIFVLLIQRADRRLKVIGVPAVHMLSEEQGGAAKLSRVDSRLTTKNGGVKLSPDGLRKNSRGLSPNAGRSELWKRN